MDSRFTNVILKLPTAIYRFWYGFFLGATEQVVLQAPGSLFHSTCLACSALTGCAFVCVCGFSACVCPDTFVRVYYVSSFGENVLAPAVRMMMVSDDCLVECKIDDDDDEDSAGAGEEQLNTPPPPPEFASKAPTPPPKPPTPPAGPAAPTPTRPENRDPYGINQHLKVPALGTIVPLCFPSL